MSDGPPATGPAQPERSESVDIMEAARMVRDCFRQEAVQGPARLFTLIRSVRADERAKLESSETMSKVRSAVIVNLEAKITKLRAELAAESDRIAKLEKAHRARLREEAERAWDAGGAWALYDAGVGESTQELADYLAKLAVLHLDRGINKEILRAGREEYERGFEEGIRSIVLIRCMAHRNVAQMNATEAAGSECAVCAVEAERAAHKARLREEVERAWGAGVNWLEWDSERNAAVALADYIRSRGLEE